MRAFWRCLCRAGRSTIAFIAIEVIGRILYWSGILYAIARVRQRFGRPRLLIPMYHRVAGADGMCRMLAIQRGVPIKTFRRQLRVLRWFGPLLTLEEAYARLSKPEQQSRTAVAITFDDGYRDFVSLVLPALREHGAAATLFPVVRTASGGRALWWDETAAILRESRCSDAQVKAVLSGLLSGAASQSALSRPMMAEAFCEQLVGVADSPRQRILGLLADRLGVTGAGRAETGTYASWDDLKTVWAAGCEIGGHTVDHVVLTHEEISNAAAQIAESRGTLQRELGQPIQSFAYPNGAHNFAIRSLTASAGYRLAVTVQPGVNYTDTNPLELRRVPLHTERPFHLALKLAFYGWVHRN